MNKTIKLIGIVLMILILTVGAFATEDNQIDAGLTPDDRLYFLDTLQEEVSLFFSRGDNRAIKSLEFAQERIAELNEVKSRDSALKVKERLKYNLNRARKTAVSLGIVKTIEEKSNEIELGSISKLNDLFDSLPEEPNKGIAIEIETVGYETLQDNVALVFEGEIFEFKLLNQDKIDYQYYGIRNGKPLDLGTEKMEFDYSVTVKDYDKLIDIAKRYENTRELDIGELEEIIEIPNNLKTKILTNAPQLLAGGND